MAYLLPIIVFCPVSCKTHRYALRKFTVVSPINVSSHGRVVLRDEHYNNFLTISKVLRNLQMYVIISKKDRCTIQTTLLHIAQIHRSRNIWFNAFKIWFNFNTFIINLKLKRCYDKKLSYLVES